VPFSDLRVVIGIRALLETEKSHFLRFQVRRESVGRSAGPDWVAAELDRRKRYRGSQ
jgi:hypothetical protein